jgi:membrane protease subunit (stomatin/prohibitin family)
MLKFKVHMDIYSEKMVYCSNCGEKMADDAYFCPKCGTKTPKGKASNATYPSDELRDAFYKVGVELERAFSIAARETHQVIKKAGENMQQKTASNPQGTIVCTSCGTKNLSGAVFCHNCGAKVASSEGSQGST